MKQISDEKTNNILALIDQGYSSRDIEWRVGVGRSTVNDIRRRYRKNAKKPASGRPAKLNATNCRSLTRSLTMGKAENAVQLANQLERLNKIKVSSQTVRRALKKSDWKAITKQKKPKLSGKNKEARLDFAKKYKKWTVKQWEKVVWSDETKINRLGSDGRQYAWIKLGQQRNSRHYKGTTKFGGGSLMLWGCMTAKGVGYATRIDGGLDAELYTAILDEELLESLWYYDLEVKNIIFQHDNDPKHLSKKAQKWIKDNDIKVLKWPSQSPDLNPIEHIWHYLKRQLKKYEKEPDSIDELWLRVEKEWNAIPTTECTKLIESMPRRIAAIIKAKGGNTKY